MSMGKKLYVGNLPASATEELLREMFSQSGVVTNAKLSFDRRGQSLGFAFIEMLDADEAAKAILRFNGALLDGKTLMVNDAKPVATRDKRRVLANRRNRGKR
mgnify:CR=1 FL=1